MFALCNGLIHTGSDTLVDHAIVIEADTITALLPQTDLPADCPRVDLHGRHITAGFIDLQLNGCGGVMFNDAPNSLTLDAMHTANLKSGTTSFLPTLITSPDQDIQSAVLTVRHYMQCHAHRVPGVHLEGPYTNKLRKGIHPVEQIRRPSDAMIAFLCEHADCIAKITLAPEKNRPEHLRQLRDAGILLSIGHSAASYAEAMAGFDNGIRFATHLYNAMTPTLNGREPGIVGAIYDRDDIYAGIIVDGHHVHPANVRLAHRVLGERLCLVTDATAPAGAPDGFTQFDFCGSTVYYRDGQCVDRHGTLGGSALTMIEGVANLVKMVGLTLDEALRMASLYPAKAINCADRLGRIAPGFIANLAIFDDDFNVLATVDQGHYAEQGQ